MQQELDNLTDKLRGISEESIRNTAHKISKIAIESYEGGLLKSGLKMVSAIAQFANDYYRCSNEPETTNDVQQGYFNPLK